MTPPRLTVFGTGNWGLCLADLAERSGSEVMVYARRPAIRDALVRDRRHPQFLPHLELGPRIQVSDSLGEAAAFSRYWLVAVPSQHMRELAQRLSPHVTGDTVVVSATKGLEEETRLRMSEVLHAVWGTGGSGPVIGALSGPNLAHDISRRRPAASVLAIAAGHFSEWGRLIGQANLRLYHQTDITGVELGGALKNVLAIAVGMAHAAGLGESAEAAIMTRGLHEMARLAAGLGANLFTLAGLSGLGDLVATASSPHSRNRWCGEELGRGRRLADILADTAMVVEGVPTAYAALALGRKLQLSMPITDEVVEIFEGKSVGRAAQDLMARAVVNESQL